VRSRKIFASLRRDELLGGYSNVTSNFSQQNWRNVLAVMKGNRRAAAIRMAKLFVRTTLPHLNEAKKLEA